MKKLLFTLLVLLILFTAVSCDDQTKKEPALIEYISVQPGGCNSEIRI